MHQKMIVRRGFLVLAALSFISPVQAQTSGSTSAVLYEGARLIAGDGSQVIASSAMLVSNGVITSVGAKGSVNAPA